MACVGIFVDAFSCRAMFNPQLVMRQGYAIIEDCDGEWEPNRLRSEVQRVLRVTNPHVVVKFLDHYAEIEMDEAPDYDYVLVVKQEAPMYSGEIH